jgi:hypothetical protein
MNSEDKCLALRNKIEECGCVIICLQETKKHHFDHSFIRKFAPRRFDKFEYIPSCGASSDAVKGAGEWTSDVDFVSGAALA